LSPDLTTRHRLYLCQPGSNAYHPCAGFIEVQAGKVTDNQINPQHLDLWRSTLEALRIELALKTIVTTAPAPEQQLP